MNKLHVIAKVAFGLLGIYLIISVITSVLSFVVMAAQSFKTFQAEAVIAIFGYGIVLIGYIWLVYYLLFRRADIFAQKIAGQEELSGSPNQAEWYPFALRLAMIAAGFMFLSKSILVSGMMVQIFQYSFRSTAVYSRASV
jgi:hypothetical protein